MIVGIDEVGRGALAGPLVVGAVLLGDGAVTGLTDSKKLTKRQRGLLDREIRQKALAIGLGWVSARDIDRHGLSKCLNLAAERALSHIRADYEQIIVDGTVKLVVDPRASTLKKADLLIPAVSAASVVAKVARDAYMTMLDDFYPDYGFGSHAGYGTARHLSAIDRHGPSPVHRMSFAPISTSESSGYMTADSRDLSPADSGSNSPDRHDAEGRRHQRKLQGKPTSRQTGDAGEEVVAGYLEGNGHTILARNWKTSRCEIDIVSVHSNQLFFTEVKHRSNATGGDGLAAITHTKVRQMRFAAETFMHHYPQYRRLDIGLAAAATSGTPAVFEQFLELG